MKEPGPSETPRGGQPMLGAVMKDALLHQAWRRGKSRDLEPLLRLLPFVRAHPVDAVLGLTFMLISSGAILALTAGARWVIDGGFAVRSERALAHVFLMAGGVAAVLAIATGLRLYFLYKLGERVVADLRKMVFRHVIGLDLTHFLELRTGEVLSRLTSDMSIVEAIVGNVVPVALRNLRHPGRRPGGDGGGQPQFHLPGAATHSGAGRRRC